MAGSARVGNKTGRVRHPHASPANKKDDNVVHDSPRAATRRRGTLRDGVRRETSTIDHIGFPVSDYPRSKAFYEKALAPLGYTLIMEVGADHTDSGSPAAGFGKQGKPDFWIGGEGGLKATTTTAPLCSIPMATTSRRCATRRLDQWTGQLRRNHGGIRRLV